MQNFITIHENDYLKCSCGAALSFSMSKTFVPKVELGSADLTLEKIEKRMGFPSLGIIAKYDEVSEFRKTHGTNCSKPMIHEHIKSGEAMNNDPLKYGV